MAFGFNEDDIVSMAFPAKSVRFGRFEVLPMQNIELSEVQLRIVFRVNEQSSHDDSVSFELHPAEFGKTVYTFDETTTKMLFYVHHHHFDCIKYNVKRLLEQFNQAGEGKVRNANCWIMIETDAFNVSEQEKFEELALYWINCQKITSKEIDKLIASILKTPKTLTSVTHRSSGGAAAESATKSKPNRIIKYPLNAKGAFVVTVQSYECLADGEFLDDAIIDFYAEYLRLEVLTVEQRAHTHMFSAFFYSVLTGKLSAESVTSHGSSTAQRRHERVAKWTKDVNIFEKDFLIVPVNIGMHWFLAIICFPWLESPVYMDTDEPLPAEKHRSSSKSDDPKPIKRPCILTFDSLGGERMDVIRKLREYLSCEYEIKMKKRRVFDESNMPGHSVRSPIQPNFHDCGLFVLQNIEQFFKDPIKSFALPIDGLEDWYAKDVATRKRRDISELIQRLIPSHGIGLSVADLPKIKLPA